ncbi:gephyrin-like molybdotransferase Glp [Okeanomitos corallinicola TIOX110]|uniref:Molybdopterin molybdenumtransferase n=1 Tax=Okeanomitos corallinicola TIOX110 TaxID=3133117 RepID=A0ABZ2UTY9_9CYAN
MLSVRDAEATILNSVKPLDNQLDVEFIDLLMANNRILATPVTSSVNFPHWDNSAMDGYAVRYADVHQARSDKPVVLEIVAEIPAGYQPQITIKPGQAARIFTGAVMPAGADTVVMQEKTHRQDNRVLIFIAPQPREFVRRKGDFYQAGTELLPGGIVLTAGEIAVLAGAGREQVGVFRRPKVAIFSSGDELVMPEQLLKPGQIVDSNQFALATLMRELGAEVLLLGIVEDDPEALTEIIDYAIANADIVISTGGVSVGDYDYIGKTLASLGGKVHFQSVQMRPGKPLTFATFPNSLYFGLPGNPVSALVTCWRFVKPAIRRMAGLAQGWGGKFIRVRSHSQLQSHGKMETYICGNLHLVNGVYQFHKAQGNDSSGNLINLVQTNALAVLPVGQTLVSPGEEVVVLQP